MGSRDFFMLCSVSGQLAWVTIMDKTRNRIQTAPYFGFLEHIRYLRKMILRMGK